MNRKRKRFVKTEETVDLTGQLTACSHVLNTKPACILMELCTSDKVQRIICEELQLNLLDLVVGHFYKFSNLVPVKLKVTCQTVRCFKFSLTTKWIKCEELVKVCQPPNCGGLTTLKGIVSEVNQELGICYLNNSAVVIINTCSRVALTPMPQKGQLICIFNAHRIPIRDNKIAYVLCAKSYLRIEDQEMSDFPDINLSPVLLSLGNKVRDYRVILWLQDCFQYLQTNFSDHFLSSSDIPKSEFNDFRSEVLRKIVKITLEKINVQSKSILEEFFSPTHNFHCGTLREEMFSVSLLNLLELNELYPVLEVDQDKDCSDFHWHSDVKEDQEKLVIAVMSVKNASYRLTQHDSHISIPSLIIPEKDTSLTGEDLATLNRKVVLVWSHIVFREKFMWLNDGVECSKVLKYLGVCPNKLQVLSPLSRDWKGANSNKKHLVLSSHKDADFVGQIKDDVIKKTGDYMTSTACSKQVNVQETFISKNVDLHCTEQYLSQYIYVQTKSSIFAPMYGRQQRYYLLVLLLGDIVPVQSRNSQARRDYQTNTTTFMILENSLLNVHPLISVDTTYEIRLPMSFDRNVFKKRSLISCLKTMDHLLPCITGVILPACSEIHLVDQCPLPSNNLKLRDCYGIEQCFKEANTSELINVIGYIVERYHQEPRFDREKINCNASGFGVPESKIIALILSDTPPGIQTGARATMYLSYWTNLQYPLALVPGAKVIFQFVVKVNPRPGSKLTSPYFRSSMLSSVEILDLSKITSSDEDLVRRGSWGPRSLLPLICQEESGRGAWLTVSAPHLISLSVMAFCSACQHPFQNGDCSFVGCSAPPNPTFYSKACFKISEFGSSAFVFVPDKMVIRLFSGFEELWKKILLLSKCFGRLEYKSKSGEEDQLTMEQRVFSIMCKVILRGRRYHMLCRPFNTTDGKEKPCDISSLYAIELYPVSLLLAAS